MGEVIEFAAWPKTPRLFRDIVVTEKIDGTNAGVIITPLSALLPDYWEPPSREVALDWAMGQNPDALAWVEIDGEHYAVAAQSRKRLLQVGADNFGFASWVYANAYGLAVTLGPGRHYGEWWGNGIQRNYGLEGKRFSLFNVHRFREVVRLNAIDEGPSYVPGLDVVPELYVGVNSEARVQEALDGLRRSGSRAAPGFDNPEGICVYHSASRQVYKALLENDHLPKGEAA